MIRFKKFELDGFPDRENHADHITAELVSDNEGAYFVADKEGPFYTDLATPVTDSEGRRLVRARVRINETLPVEAVDDLKAGRLDFGKHVFEQYPPTHAGVYAVADNVMIVITSGFFENGSPSGSHSLSGHSVLRELVPPAE
jgi:hypothetical protein